MIPRPLPTEKALLALIAGVPMVSMAWAEAMCTDAELPNPARWALAHRRPRGARA